jgi:hypothetical protein
MITLDTDLCIIILVGLMLYVTWRTFDRIIFPQMVYHGMKEVERNPKWVTSQLQYYGFNDIDIVLCTSKYGMLPRFRASKDNRIELWIDNDTSTKDIEEVGRLALVGKIKAKYGLWFPDKPIYWLSILCYMLDGGDVNMIDKKQETS